MISQKVQNDIPELLETLTTDEICWLYYRVDEMWRSRKLFESDLNIENELYLKRELGDI